jgi:hypothetical protein
MKPLVLTAILGLAAPAWAELADEHIVIRPEQLWIEVVEPIEILWIGKTLYERTQVLSGPDIGIVGLVTDPLDAALVGARAVVVEVLGTHSCEDLTDPTRYYVITLGSGLVTDGPLTTCGEMTMSLVDGGIVLEADPMGEGSFWVWRPGQGFKDRLE